MRKIFGGAVLEMVTVGEPAYESWAAMAWNAHDACFRMVYASSMGEAGVAESRWVDDVLVSTQTKLRGGEPAVVRSTMACDASGAVTRSESHWIAGLAEPMRAFAANYAKQE
jgi:hypothetical protein